MTEPLDNIIRKVKRKIIRTKSKYEKYAIILEDTYEDIEKVDEGSIPLLGDLIEVMERYSSKYRT